MRIIFIFILSVLVGCGGGTEQEPPAEQKKADYIVAGQSNAVLCNWGYFERKTGSQVIMIAKGASTIKDLIEGYESIGQVDAEAIIFVHGEQDARRSTPPGKYVEMVESYRLLISLDVGKSLPLYISTVGYVTSYEDHVFDVIRDAVKEYENDNWFIAFDNAQYFREWGMLKDSVHFNEQGCETMMDGIIDFIGHKDGS